MFSFDRFDALIKEQGISKAFLAEKIGRHKTIFYDWQKGNSAPKKEYLDIIADILGTTPAYLTGESDDPGHAPEPTPAQRQLLSLAETLTNEELQKTLEYAAFLKSQRGK
ncbi:helix-turn-helix transcriptional regulator [Ruthenibacterium lactatiformans]|uniref:helix-turn-helix domain-containing protein n=1 Tax=Ruthenibacterium lactatiformans TaxID=1550024 RepID=UPI001967837D|nr:helix-turn-helix transcriptional regulator [Ruthenibacterium lactatiformans]MBN3018652.1 helix-turn-helix transcriptional regulator [Ruthenibacterium lactatiformans]